MIHISLICSSSVQSVAETCKIPMVLIMFAFCCLSVVPVCFYSHSSAMPRTAAFLMGIGPQECGFSFGLCGQWEERENRKWMQEGNYSFTIVRAAAWQRHKILDISVLPKTPPPNTTSDAHTHLGEVEENDRQMRSITPPSKNKSRLMIP